MTDAGVGTRGPNKEGAALLALLGQACALQGHRCISGGAPGCDQSFMLGAARVRNANLHIFLPWRTFEAGRHPPGAGLTWSYSTQAWDLARDCHPRWGATSDGAHRLFARNAAMAMAVGRTGIVYALPRLDERLKPTGGTAHMLHCAKAVGCEVWDLTISSVYQDAIALLQKLDLLPRDQPLAQLLRP